MLMQANLGAVSARMQDDHLTTAPVQCGESVPARDTAHDTALGSNDVVCAKSVSRGERSKTLPFSVGWDSSCVIVQGPSVDKLNCVFV